MGERIPEENIATVSEENIIDILKRYKKKMISYPVCVILADAGETYIVSAYSHINQVLETFRSEGFVLSLLIMTGVLTAFWVVLFIMNKMRIGTF